FFFQAEDGIRDFHVTGVQTCALPIFSTISENKPHARVVLLKGFTPEGFEFYTNYHSHKGSELNENPNSALTFFYDALERQIRIRSEERRVGKESRYVCLICNVMNSVL